MTSTTFALMLKCASVCSMTSALLRISALVPAWPGVAQTQDVEWRERPGPVGLRVQHALDGDGLVGEPGDGRGEGAVRRRGRLVGLRGR